MYPKVYYGALRVKYTRMSYWKSEMDRLSYIQRRMYNNAVECATMNALNVNIQWHHCLDCLDCLDNGII